MSDLLDSLSPDGGFMPHIHCYLGRPSIVWTMFVTDLAIGIAYVGIALTLWGLVRRIRIPFNAVVLCFGVFIAACGGTHLMEVWTLWRPDYWWAAAVKVVTTVASVGTGIYLYRLRHPIATVAEAAKLSEQRRLDLEALTRSLEERVEERTSRLQLALDATGLGIWDWDLRTGVITWDTALERIFGIPAGSFGGRYEQFEALLHPEDRARVRRSVDEAVRERRDFQERYRVVQPGGSLRWIASRGRLLVGPDGAALRLIGTALDITDRVRDEEALRGAVVARDEFISVASHELRTPLTSVGIQLQMLERNLRRGGMAAIEQPALTRALHTASRQLGRLGRLVEDMLDISRLSTGNLNCEVAEHDLSAVVAEALERVGPELAAAGCQLQASIAPGLRASIDAVRIEQVVGNLAGNAAKYGPGRPVEVTLVRAGELAELRVRDEGMGIPRDAQHRIFERFERAVEGSSVSGLGLGLYIVRSIVEAHGGTVAVESEPGKGALFIVTLPLLHEPAVTPP